MHCTVIDVYREMREHDGASMCMEAADIAVECAVKTADDLFMFWRQVNGAELDLARLDDLHAIYKGVRAWQK